MTPFETQLNQPRREIERRAAGFWDSLRKFPYAHGVAFGLVALLAGLLGYGIG